MVITALNMTMRPHKTIHANAIADTHNKTMRQKVITMKAALFSMLHTIIT